MRSLYYTIVFFTLVMITSGCLRYDRLLSYQEPSPALQDSLMIMNTPNIVIQPDDVLRVQVFGPDETTAAPFNLPAAATNINAFQLQVIQLSGYLVDQNGYIDLPVLGEIKVSGLTVPEIKELIKEKLMVHLKEAIVNVRLLNFRVSVSGEVNRPGQFFVVNERITIPEALTMAGGLTNYADRTRVLVVREENGIRTFKRINLQSTDVFQSEYFYLRQNDLINVDPIRARAGAVQDQTNKTIPIITAAATLVAVIVSITR